MTSTTATDATRDDAGRCRKLAAASLAGFLVAAAEIVALHFLRRDLGPSGRQLSEYAVGERGWLMTTAFLAAAVGAGALAVLLRTTVKESRSTRVGCRALWVAAASEALMAVFVTDLRIATLGEPLVRTIHGRIHDGLALFHGIAWTIAVVVLPIAFTADRRWFRISRVSWLLTLFIVWAVAARVLAPSYDSGLTQRIWIASIFGWGVIHAAAGGRRCAVRDGATAT